MKKKRVIGAVALIAVFAFASVFIGNIRSDKLQGLRENESQDNKLELEKEISSVPFSDEIDDTSEMQSESEDNRLDLKKEIYDKSMVE